MRKINSFREIWFFFNFTYLYMALKYWIFKVIPVSTKVIYCFTLEWEFSVLQIKNFFHFAFLKCTSKLLNTKCFQKSASNHLSTRSFKIYVNLMPCEFMPYLCMFCRTCFFEGLIYLLHITVAVATDYCTI